jgi:hypothetical protein
MDSTRRQGSDLAAAVAKTLSIAVNCDCDFIDILHRPDKTVGW